MTKIISLCLVCVPVEIQIGYISVINWKHYCLSQHSHSVNVN